MRRLRACGVCFVVVREIASGSPVSYIRGQRVDNPIGVLSHFMDNPLKDDMVGYLVDVRKDLGCGSACHIDSALDRASIRRWSAVLALVWLENGNERTEIRRIK